MSSNIKKNNIELWDHNRGIIHSSIGGWKIGEAVYNHGYSMMDDFVGKLSYMQVIMLNSTGRIPSRELADWVEGVHICMSWPDPRIWCNQIGALGGSNRTSVIAATTAGVLANDSRSYGTKPLLEGLAFVQTAMKLYRDGKTIEDIINKNSPKHAGKPLVMGYARPIAKGDVRIPSMEKLQKELGIKVGEHQELANLIDRYLAENYDETINFNGYASAVLSDHEYTPEEAYRLFSVLVASGVTACYVDCMNKPAETFLAQRCNDIEYIGRPIRELPE